MAHDDIDQIAASSRLSVHDIKSNPSVPVNDASLPFHGPVANARIANSEYPTGRNSTPIVLTDNANVTPQPGTM